MTRDGQADSKRANGAEQGAFGFGTIRDVLLPTMDTTRPRPVTEETAADAVLEQANTIFQFAWKEVRGRIESGAARLPREIIWLGGAPGSG
jgi:hypothetical protein